jgi:hypothetical protein
VRIALDPSRECGTCLFWSFAREPTQRLPESFSHVAEIPHKDLMRKFNNANSVTQPALHKFTVSFKSVAR